jgi:hypothetical protein
MTERRGATSPFLERSQLPLDRVDRDRKRDLDAAPTAAAGLDLRADPEFAPLYDTAQCPSFIRGLDSTWRVNAF